MKITQFPKSHVYDFEPFIYRQETGREDLTPATAAKKAEAAYQQGRFDDAYRLIEIADMLARRSVNG